MFFREKIQKYKMVKPISKESSVDSTPTTWGDSNYVAIRSHFILAPSVSVESLIGDQGNWPCRPIIPADLRIDLAVPATGADLMADACRRVRLISDIDIKHHHYCWLVLTDVYTASVALTLTGRRRATVGYSTTHCTHTCRHLGSTVNDTNGQSVIQTNNEVRIHDTSPFFISK